MNILDNSLEFGQQNPDSTRQKINTKNFELLEAILEALPQSIFLFDQNKYIIGIYNVDPVTLAGWKVEDIVGKHLSFFSTNPASPFYQACSSIDKHFVPVFKTGISERFEYMIQDFYLEATISKIKEDRILCQVRNISDLVRKRQEIERKGRNETSIALTAGGLTSWSYDVKTQILTSSQDNNIIGDQMPLEVLMEQIVPEHKQKTQQLFTQLIRGETKHCEITLKVKNKKGQWQWTNVHAVPHTYSQDGLVETIIGSQKNVTREYELTQEMENNRIKLELAIQSGGLKQWEYNVSADSIEIWGSNNFRNNKISFSKEFKKEVHPEDLVTLETEILKLINLSVPYSRFNIRLLTENEYRWYAINASIFLAKSKSETMSIIGLAKDITEDILTRNELIGLRNKAEEANRLKTAFIANMSHEIRTPLNAIVGFSSLIATADDKEEAQSYLKIVEQNNQLLLNLINDVLDLSRIEAGKIEFNFALVNIQNLFSQLRSNTQLKANADVLVAFDPVDENFEIVTDSVRLSQILTNFLTNATKFTHQGEIRFGCEQIQGGTRFYVKDTGTGIPTEKLSTIFERFVKLDAYVQGTGLGLSICQTIINLLHGKIGVDSELGKGSQFWCILPHRTLQA